MAFSEKAGIYLHIPFCRAKCPYCDFFSLPVKTPPQDAYLQALKKELLLRKEEGAGLVFETVYVGGGTPSLFSPDFFREWFAFLDLHLDLKLKEATIEVNPEGVSLEFFKKLRPMFNRVSIGAQSLSEKGLQVLGRRHKVCDILRALEGALEAGFQNVSLDFIFAWPGQGLKDWARELEAILALPVTHLSFYELTIEPGTPFYELQQKGLLEKPPEEEIEEMFLLLWERTRARGFEHYEISNYSRPGYACRHNLLYWKVEPFIGLGPAAASYLRGTRKKNVEGLSAYMQALREERLPLVEEEKLDKEAHFREAVILGLRLIEGVERKELQDRFGFDLVAYYGVRLERLVRQGLVSWEGERLKLTPKGLLLANVVARELV